MNFYADETYGERIAGVYDLMAQIAGLRLRERWSTWARAPFDSTSGKHISIYERAN